MSHDVIIGVSLGDPSGIGTEVALKAALEFQRRPERWRLLLVGSLKVAAATLRRLKIPLSLREVAGPEEVASDENSTAILNIPGLEEDGVTFGRIDPACAVAATSYVKVLLDLALTRRIAAVACAPISKHASLLAGSEHGGHSELIASRYRSDNYAMYFTSPELAVMTVTGHVQLQEVASRITAATVARKIKLGHTTFLELRDRPPRIAVCSLDPHCGEGGMLGRADAEIVAPAVAAAREDGIAVQGPISADAVFRPYLICGYDLVVGMYHDQVKVAVAALDSDRFVAYLAGIPIVRTTTTHGSAHDIAGRGIARHANMVRSIEVAAEIARKRFPSLQSCAAQRGCVTANHGG